MRKRSVGSTAATDRPFSEPVITLILRHPRDIFEKGDKSLSVALMSNGNGDVIDGELSALLDSALEDFGRARNTDAELDSMMETMDREAAQKAASNFDSMMRNLTNGASSQPGNTNSSSPQTPMTEEERHAAENFQKMLKALVEAEEKAIRENQMDTGNTADCDIADANAFLQQLRNLSEQDPTRLTDDSHIESLMNLMQTFFAKDLMYPSIKQLVDSYPGRTNCEKQMELLRRICEEYEKEESDDAEVMRNRFEAISSLMVELQSYGYPPEELVGSAPPGWSVDPVSGFPAIEDVSKAAESCTIM
uniref:Peroxin-19 n=1 Tax=Parascaris equorum TaxID=6256 RepID=A0A914RLL6_PAREQ